MSEYEAVIYQGFNQLNPKDWDSFVEQSPQRSLFSKSWWLQAMSSNRLEILVLYKGQRIVAGMPMVRLHKYGYKKICMPGFTKMLGVLFEPPTSQKYTITLSNEMRILKELVRSIPPFDNFTMNFHYSFNNWLPFLWAGYSQTTYYSYVIPDLTDLDKLWDNFSRTARTEIRKAEKAGIKVEESENIEECIHINTLTFGRQSLSSPYHDKFVRILDDVCRRQKARKFFLARDPQGRIHSMCYLVYDSMSAYALMAGADPALRNSSAQYLVWWTAIQSMSALTRQFDFTGGSFFPNIESHLRNFGGILTPYYTISKDNTSTAKKLLLSSYKAVRNTWNKLTSL
jgi:hypothetical protein